MPASALAIAAGISRNTLYLIEKRAANTQVETIERLAIALDVDPYDFFDVSAAPSVRRRRNVSLCQCVSQNVFRYRKQLGLSQEGLVRAASLPRGYIWRVERTAPDMSLEVVDRIAAALKVQASLLFKE